MFSLVKVLGALKIFVILFDRETRTLKCLIAGGGFAICGRGSKTSMKINT